MEIFLGVFLYAVLFGTVAIVALKLWWEKKEDEFKASFGFDPKLAKKLGRQGEAEEIVVSTLSALEKEVQRNKGILDGVPLSQLHSHAWEIQGRDKAVRTLICAAKIARWHGFTRKEAVSEAIAQYSDAVS